MAKFAFTNLTNLLLSFITFSNIIYNKQEHYDRLTARTRWNTYYDYIIIGGGTAGSVLAARLSEDESLTVLLLEAGGSETVSSNTPGLQDTLLGSLMDWKFASTPQNWSCQAMNDRRCLLSAGRVIGGTSSINRMYYLRGNPQDYDGWVERFGLKDWGWKDTFPFIIRNENQTDPERARSGYFGVNGPMPLERSPEYNHLLETFVFTSKISGYRMSDLNTGVPIGTSILQTTTRKGKRMSTASAFLEPHLKRKNLHILSNSFVYQIMFDGRQAIGVKFYRNWKPYTVYAKQEILLAAGAINSAKLLLLSGVGPRQELAKHNIPVVADLPVGENLHDHVGSGGLHFLVDMANELVPSTSVTKQTLKQYFHTGKGPLAEARVAATLFKSSAVTGTAVIGTTDGGVPILESSRQDYFTSGAYGHPESADLMLMAYLNGIGSKEATAEQAQQRTNLRQEVWNRFYMPNRAKHQLTIVPVVLKPKSRGTVRLHSANPVDSPLVDPNYLDHSDDMDRMVEAMREALRLVQTRPFRAFNTELFRTIVPGCEAEAPFQKQEPNGGALTPTAFETSVVEESMMASATTTSAHHHPHHIVPSQIVSFTMPPPPALPPPASNLSIANKIVATILTKLLFDGSKKESYPKQHQSSSTMSTTSSSSSFLPSFGSGGGFGSFFGFNRKHRIGRRDTGYLIRRRVNHTHQSSPSVKSGSHYERYWLHGTGRPQVVLASGVIDPNWSDTLPLKDNMIDGFSSMAVPVGGTTPVHHQATEEEILSVWSNHKNRNRTLIHTNHNNNNVGGGGGGGGVSQAIYLSSPHYPHYHQPSMPTVSSIYTTRRRVPSTTTPWTTTTTTSTTTITSTTTTTTTRRPSTTRWTLPPTFIITSGRPTTTMTPSTTTTSSTSTPTTTTTSRPTTTTVPSTITFPVYNTETVTANYATTPPKTTQSTPIEITQRTPTYATGAASPSATSPPPPTAPSSLPVPPLSDRYLRCVARQLTTPMGDYVGTARMGSDEDLGRVVDGRFRVVGGVEGLRVIDASVVPEIVAGGMAPVAMMLGERGAEFIKEELRQSTVTTGVPGGSSGIENDKRRRRNRNRKNKQKQQHD